MIRIIALVLGIVITVVVIASVGYLVVKSVINLINGLTVGDAISNAWQNYTNFVLSIFGKAHAEPDVIYEMTNKCINVVGCTAL